MNPDHDGGNSRSAPDGTLPTWLEPVTPHPPPGILPSIHTHLPRIHHVQRVEYVCIADTEPEPELHLRHAVVSHAMHAAACLWVNQPALGRPLQPIKGLSIVRAAAANHEI